MAVLLQSEVLPYDERLLQENARRPQGRLEAAQCPAVLHGGALYHADPAGQPGLLCRNAGRRTDDGFHEGAQGGYPQSLDDDHFCGGNGADDQPAAGTEPVCGT